MKILLTGATGFVGKELGKSLVRLGHEIYVLARDSKKAKASLPFPAQVFEWKDITQIPPAEAFHDCDTVIHLAGEPIAGKRWTDEQKKKIKDSRVQSSLSLQAALQKYAPPIKRALFASAIGFYGDRKEEILTEKSDPAEGFLSEVCQEWESSHAGITKSGVSSATVRIRIVLGSQGGMLKEVIPLFQKNIAGVLGDGKQWMSWIHLEDLVRIFISLLEENKNFEGVINAAAPVPVTNRVFTDTLSNVMQKKNFLTAPAFGLKLALGEMSAVVLSSARAIPTQLHELGFSFRYNDLKAALYDVWNREKNDEEFVSEIWINKPIEEIVSFFADAKNLEAITPDWLNFKIEKMSTEKIEPGTLIDYKLKIHGVPARWTTRIEEYTPSQFVDSQIKGPYKKWHHTHTFEKLGEGTLMTDRVLYQVPLGLLGKLTAGPLVNSDVKKIFEFREKKIKSIFGG